MVEPDSQAEVYFIHNYELRDQILKGNEHNVLPEPREYDPSEEYRGDKDQIDIENVITPGLSRKHSKVLQ